MTGEKAVLRRPAIRKPGVGFGFGDKFISLIELVNVPEPLDDCSKDVAHGQAYKRGNSHHDKLMRVLGMQDCSPKTGRGWILMDS